MNRITVTSVIDIYEINDKEIEINERNNNHITVSSHWNRSNFVILNIEGKKFTVSADELDKAIENAINC